jgi:hypothetical protein
MTGGAALLMGAAREGSAKGPLFRFVQVNDLHVQSDDSASPAPKPKNYARANEKARWVVEAINREAFLPLPDFAVGVGDLIHGGTPDRLRPDLDALRGILKPLKCPFYPVVGNHEVVQQERSAEHLRPYVDAFGANRVEYTFRFKGVLFVALNNSGAPSGEAARKRNEWLGRVLKENWDTPKIILCHIPLIALRDEATLAKSFGFNSDFDRDLSTLKLVEQHSDSVIAVLSGHLHLTGMKMGRSVCHFSLSGTASYPSDGAASFGVFPDRVRVAVHPLPAELARAASSIHGKPRHERDYMDAEHDSAEKYQCGVAAERDFTVPLPEGKRPQP